MMTLRKRAFRAFDFFKRDKGSRKPAAQNDGFVYDGKGRRIGRLAKNHVRARADDIAEADRERERFERERAERMAHAEAARLARPPEVVMFDEDPIGVDRIRHGLDGFYEKGN